MPCLTTRLPLEILDYIAFHLATFEPLGPPSHLLPLLLTSYNLYAALSPATNPALYARIFRAKFDTHAVERRAFTPTHTQCVEQLVHYCRALQVLRAGDVFVDAATAEAGAFDRNADEALLTAFVMMLEDDGKNARQLLAWARADVFAERFVRRRLYEARERNDGWPRESGPNACALWLMWMLTSEEKLRSETPAQREQMIKLLLPFVFVPLRYPTAEAPPHFYHLPLTSGALPVLPNSHASPHGAYPTYAASAMRPAGQVYFGTRPLLSYPLAAPAAKLLFFARRELSPLAVPPHFALTRAHAHAAGNFEVGATVEDLRELNWSWTARLPLGAGTASAAATTTPPTTTTTTTTTTTMTTATIASSTWAPLPWAGKAPHSRRREKSRGWDADWWRLRLCGDPQRATPRVRYGRVYEPGCMDGLWVGRMMITEATLTQFIMQHATHPPPGVLTDDAPATQQAAVYMRLREAHAVVGDAAEGSRRKKRSRNANGAGMGGGTAAFDEGLGNAWFPGATGSVRVRRGAGGPGGGAERVVLEGAEGVGGVYRCWKGRGARAAGGDTDTDTDTDAEEQGEWEGYPHDAAGCRGCRARAEMAERLRVREAREAREREALFGGVGLGLGLEQDADEDDVDPAEADGETETEEAEEEEEEWDPVGETVEFVTGDGERVYPAQPRAHCRRKVLPCDGVKEIVLFGETDERHGQAWHHYTFYGRVRPWDGLIGILRAPRDPHNGYLFFYGYLVGGENFVGNWRVTSADPTGPVWECAFAMSRREEE